jgi:hypothetical protein
VRLIQVFSIAVAFAKQAKFRRGPKRESVTGSKLQQQDTNLFPALTAQFGACHHFHSGLLFRSKLARDHLGRASNDAYFFEEE